MNKISMFIKISISLFCLLVLVILFCFGGVFFERNAEELTLKEENENFKDVFVFDPEELSYDGTGELDLLEGVSLENFSLETLKSMVFIRISTGENMSQKVVEYTADTDEGRVRSKRILRLQNYRGPEIQLPDEMPSISTTDIGNMAEVMLSENDYKADDGFGNDARKHVQIETEKSLQNSSLIQCTFILVNEFEDRAVAKADITLSDVPAVLVLINATVNLQIGEFFDPLQYVESAVDSEGRSIIDEVVWDGEIDTSRTGVYEIVYELRGQTVKLTVNVNT